MLGENRCGKSFILFLVALLLALPMKGEANSDRVLRSTEDALDFMHSVYQTTYAPAPWKQQFANWDLEAEYLEAKSAVKAKGTALDVTIAREIVKSFVYSMRDYHVSVRFNSTESSTLPLMVRGAEGRYFIVYIDREKLSEDIFPFQIGDEVVEFAGRPVAEVVAEIRAQTEENVASTDQARAEMALTSRAAARGHRIESGPVTIGVKRKDGDTVGYRQLIWEHKEEEIRPIFRTPYMAFEPVEAKSVKPLIPRFQMSADLAVESAVNPFTLGYKKSFLPAFGDVIWEAPEEEAFQAYIYRDENNKMVGVVRIPSYSLDAGGKDENTVYADSVASFSRIINKMEKFTDKLVIDQLNNPGGSVFYLYALASILSPNPLKTPSHTMSITPADVMECVQSMKKMEEVKNDESAKKIMGENIHGYPVNFQVVEFYRNFCRTIMADWNAGELMSRPYWIAGVDQLNPYPKGTYSKPITILVNELDFSGGDFFPTVMQDNQRAKIFGSRTAGAGGYVNEFSFPNLLGIQVFRVTQSLAHRVSNEPIENLGVTPDIEYEMKASDRQNNYADYIKAVKAAIQ